MDIDSLSVNLKEAQELIKFCRDKLYKADEEIKDVYKRQVDAGVTKFFWGDRMSVKLSGTDLFHGMKSGNRMYYN